MVTLDPNLKLLGLFNFLSFAKVIAQFIGQVFFWSIPIRFFVGDASRDEFSLAFSFF